MKFFEHRVGVPPDSKFNISPCDLRHGRISLMVPEHYRIHFHFFLLPIRAKYQLAVIHGYNQKECTYLPLFPDGLT